MWVVANKTPFAAERGWVRDGNGASVWLVAVKCTFDIHPDGTTTVAAKQPPVLHIPEPYGDPGASSLRYEADLVASKRTTDILVVGHACAPQGREVQEMSVGFRVGPVSKVLHVSGDRTWTALGASRPQPFTRMPLVFERAFGGVDDEAPPGAARRDLRNPVGTGFALERARLHGRALPNIELPGERVRSWGDRPTPAGFGPVASHWHPRATFAGTCDEHWKRTRQPLLPQDFDDRFYQCAPPDQQAPEFLQGGEEVVLHNLTPEGDLRFRLPRLHLGFETRFHDGTRQVHRTRALHTVILEPDFPRFSLVWHTSLACHFKRQLLERTIVTLKSVVGTQPGRGTAPEIATNESDLSP